MIQTDIDFPRGLPCPLRADYGFQHGETFVRTKMQAGRERQRRSFTSVPSGIPVAWRFRADTQVAAFEAWFRDAIDDGAAWFNVDLLTPLGKRTPCVCRFTAMYKGPAHVGLKSWRVEASLEVYERPLMPPGWGLLPEFAIGADIFDLAMNREWPET